ncbi:MAG TPA: hypothetical protein VNT60_01650 [Deinococcales bacterium]|nr:hypothetical protein [Deinococcales bacterium]
MEKQQSPARTSTAYVLIVVALLIFAGQNLQIDLSREFWPFTVIIPGLALLAGMVLFGRPAAPLAVPGTLITATGALLLYQNTFNAFESWAYAWPLIAPGSIGLGLWLGGHWSGNARQRATGLTMAVVGLVLTVVCYAAFTGLVFIPSDYARHLVPLAMIAVALVMLLNPQRSRQ